MKRPTMFGLLVFVLGLAGFITLTYGAQRIRVIDVDGTTNQPMASAAVTVTNAPPTAQTNTITVTTQGGFITNATSLVSVVVTSASISQLTMIITNIDSINIKTNILNVVTNETLNLLTANGSNVFFKANAVTNATGFISSMGFASSNQLSAIISNENLIYQMLQPSN